MSVGISARGSNVTAGPRRLCHRAAILAALVVLGATVACAPERSGGALSYATMPRLGLVPGTAFCEGAGAEGCAFVDIDVAAVGPDGRVALAGPGGAVAEFDRAGRFVRRIGRAGRGPGEYRAVMAAVYDSAATLALFDAGTWRVVRFDSVGRALSADRVEPPTAVQDAAFAGSTLVFFALPGGGAVGDSVTARFYGVGSDGAASVLLGEAPARAIATGDESMIPMLPPFTPRPRWSVAPDGSIYFAEGGRYESIVPTDRRRAPSSPSRSSRRQ